MVTKWYIEFLPILIITSNKSFSKEGQTCVAYHSSQLSMRQKNGLSASIRIQKNTCRTQDNKSWDELVMQISARSNWTMVRRRRRENRKMMRRAQQLLGSKVQNGNMERQTWKTKGKENMTLKKENTFYWTQGNPAFHFKWDCHTPISKFNLRQWRARTEN